MEFELSCPDCGELNVITVDAPVVEWPCSGCGNVNTTSLPAKVVTTVQVVLGG